MVGGWSRRESGSIQPYVGGAAVSPLLILAPLTTFRINDLL
jgi:hypothetical protein